MVNNLSIGWVVKIIRDRNHSTPGYTLIRKIVYNDNNWFGIDALFNINQEPIIYPVVDFQNNSDLLFLEDGKYVIMPFASIDNYLHSFGILCKDRLNYYQKKKIKNLVFGNSIAVEEPLFLNRKVDLEKYKREKERLRDFKIYNLSTTVNKSESDYLEAINSYRKIL